MTQGMPEEFPTKLIAELKNNATLAGLCLLHGEQLVLELTVLAAELVKHSPDEAGLSPLLLRFYLKRIIKDLGVSNEALMLLLLDVNSRALDLTSAMEHSERT